MSPRIALALALAASAAAVPPAGAATACSAPSLLVRWPEEQPVWELCWTRPRDSGGASSETPSATPPPESPPGSGLELTHVRYRGLPLLERAHAPAVWTRWAEPGEPGCAGRCRRARTSEESPFAAGAEVVPGWYQPDPPLWPLATACDRPSGAIPSGAAAFDCPWGEPLACVTGVSIERGAERLTLTSQLVTGELRSVMSWTFRLDGTIEPRFAFARGGSACAGTPVRGHVVWRLDLEPGAGERLLAAGDGAGWRVGDGGEAARGYQVVPGAGDLEPALHASAGDPEPPAGLGGCGFDPAALPPFVPASGRGQRTDLVLWYHAAADAPADGCGTVGPTLRPFGAWPRAGEPIFGSDFESGGLEEWSRHRSGSEDGGDPDDGDEEGSEPPE